MTSRPDREWWTAAEIAAVGLPDMPSTKRRVNAMADREGWAARTGLSRKRTGRGGGREYHFSLFPVRAQSWLIAQAEAAPEAPAQIGRAEAWAAYDALPEKAKVAAQDRLDAIQKIEVFERAGASRDQAVQDVARLIDRGARTLWNWLALVDGVRADDRLPYLAPKHRNAKRASRAIGVDPEFGDLIKSDFLRPEQPSFRACYDRSERIARAKGWDIPALHTVRRWFKREVSEMTVILMRKGLDALKAMYPPQIRDRSNMHALEGVNGDFHRFDVFVRFPGDAVAPAEIIRPQMVAFQDLFSGRILSWRVDVSANSHAVQLCLGDLIEDWGIPEHVLLDNGREFAAKLITGGTKTRFRFKVREDDVPGLLTSLGCEVHWATPYSGQSKPIERAFRDLCDRVAKHPRFAGAYTGNKPDAKPENYGDRAVPLEEFLEVLAQEIELHNLRPDRRSDVAFGRSFAEVFEESYAAAPIRKATAEQRRLWLMGAEGLRPSANTGAIKFMGNEYWAPWLHQHRGEKLLARFDRAALWDGLHMYALSGEYLGLAECREKGGFFDIGDARAHARTRRAWVKAEREAAKQHKVYTAAKLGQQLADLDPPAPDAPGVEAKIVRMMPKAKGAAPQPDRIEDAPAHAAFVADFEAHRSTKAEKQGEAESRDLFIRARDLEERQAAGKALTKDQQKWLASYQQTPDYRSWAAMVEDFGEDVLAK